LAFVWIYFYCDPDGITFKSEALSRKSWGFFLSSVHVHKGVNTVSARRTSDYQHADFLMVVTNDIVTTFADVL